MERVGYPLRLAYALLLQVEFPDDAEPEEVMDLVATDLDSQLQHQRFVIRLCGDVVLNYDEHESSLDSDSE